MGPPSPAVAVPSLICLVCVFVAAAAVLHSQAPRPPAPARNAGRPADAPTLRRTYVAGILRAERLWKDHPKECEEALVALRDDPALSDLRDFEWYYLWARCHFRLIHRCDVGAAVTAADLTPDGRLLATGTADGAVALWDVDTWNKTAVLSACTGPVNALAFSPDGGLLACGGGSSDGRGQAGLFSLATGEKIRDLKGRPGRITGLAFSLDSATLATCGPAGPGPEDRSEFRLWDVKSGDLMSRADYPGEGTGFFSCALQGPRVALGDSDGKVWEYPWVGSANSLAPFACRGVANGAHEVLCLRGNGNGNSPSDLLAYGTRYGRVGWMDETVGGGLAIFQLQGASVGSVQFGPTWLAAGDETGRIRVWGCHTGRLMACVPALDGEVHALKLCLDGRTLVSGGGDGRLNVWDVGDATAECRRMAHGDPDANLLKEAWAVAFSPDGRTMASAGDDNVVKVWDPVGGAEKPRCLAHGALVSCVAYSPDGTTIASGGYDNEVILWESATGKAMHRLLDHKAPVRCLAFSPDGRTLATGSRDKTVQLWDVKTGERRWAFPGEAGTVRTLAFSPDGRRLVQAGAGGKIRFWDLPDEGGEPSAGLVLSDLADEVRCAAFSPDGKTLATGDKDGWVRLWDAATGDPRGAWKEHDLGVNDQAGVNTLAFTPDGRTLATGGDDKRVKLWQAASGDLLLTLSEEAGKINGLAFDRDGRTLAVASHDGAVRLWRGPHPVR